MIINNLFWVDEKSGTMRSRPRKHCLIRTLSPEGKKDAIYGLDPEVRHVDGEFVVVYTERYGILQKKNNRGKRMIVPLAEIVEAKTWDLYAMHAGRRAAR